MRELLERSGALESTLLHALGGDDFMLAEGSARVLRSASACALSNEHAAVLRLAFAGAAPNTGSALLRLQFEALVRAAWLLHAATDEQVARAAAPLDLNAEQAAKNLPGATVMLAALATKAPVGLVQPLQQFSDVSWKALNSFVHAGLHPLHRLDGGFPVSLGQQLVRNSNGLLHMSYRMLASLSGRADLMDTITRLWPVFPDCFPLMDRA